MNIQYDSGERKRTLNHWKVPTWELSNPSQRTNPRFWQRWISRQETNRNHGHYTLLPPFLGSFPAIFQVAQLWSSCVVGICRKLEIVWLSFLWLVGGWPTPLKNMSSSIGMMTFPIYGKTKVMFQTTNQLWSSWLVNFLLLQYDPFPSHQVRSPTISGNVLTLWPCGGRKNMEVKNPFVRPRHPRHKHSGALSDLLRSWKKKPVDWFFHHTKN